MRTYDEPECECDSPLKLSQGCRILDKHGNRTTTATIPLLFTPGPLVVMSCALALVRYKPQDWGSPHRTH